MATREQIRAEHTPLNRSPAAHPLMLERLTGPRGVAKARPGTSGPTAMSPNITRQGQQQQGQQCLSSGHRSHLSRDIVHTDVARHLCTVSRDITHSRGSRTRTYNLRFWRPPLYQIELCPSARQEMESEHVGPRTLPAGVA
jgi:hypothetical protein